MCVLGFDNTKPLPLIFGAHGRHGTASGMKRTDFAKLASKTDDFILVYPEGMQETGLVFLYHKLTARLTDIFIV